MRARNIYSSKAESRAKRRRRMSRMRRRNGDRANGRLQVQPVYIAGTTDSRRSMADMRARYTTDRAKPINFPFNSPGPSSAPSRLPTYPSTYSSCSSHSDSQGSVSRKIGIPLAESSGLRSAFSRSALDGCAARILASRCVACEREARMRVFDEYNVVRDIKRVFRLKWMYLSDHACSVLIFYMILYQILVLHQIMSMR